LKLVNRYNTEVSFRLTEAQLDSLSPKVLVDFQSGERFKEVNEVYDQSVVPTVTLDDEDVVLLAEGCPVLVSHGTWVQAV